MFRHGRLWSLFLLSSLLLLPLMVSAQSPYASSIVEELPTTSNGVTRSDLADTVKVILELQDEPTTQTFAGVVKRGSEADATTAAQAQLARIERAQQRLLTAVSQADPDAAVIYRTQRVYNGIAVQIEADAVLDLAQSPDVKAVHPLITKQRNHTTSVPLIGAPELWASAGLDVTGENMSIGIIDTGIDYLHTNFGGSGDVADFEGNDTTVITDEITTENFGPGNKVVGGFDFVGDTYNADKFDPDLPYQPIPNPDPDPMDCQGHGTHVAGTAGGFGVNADGTTYTGGYDDVPFDELKIGPGVAPEADLYALRVFGCDGSTDVTDQAIEYAVDPNGDGDFSDRLDVINMSLGSPFGGIYDSSTIASDNAALIGVVVVASAGNSDDTYYITGSPGSSSRTLSVASSVDASAVVGGFTINSPESITGNYPANEADFGPDLSETGPLTGTIAYPENQPGGCEPFDATDAALLDGNIALIDRGDCNFTVKVKNAQDAGAVGVLIANNVPGDPFNMGGGDDTITIPSMMTTLEVGDLIKGALDDDDEVEVTLTSEFRNQVVNNDPSRNDTLSNFSSRGPRRVDSVLKPDIAAPGQTIFSADVGTGSEGRSSNGTSMAAPHMAGAMALLRQIHPDWTVEELKALAMNTATNDLFTDLNQEGMTYSPARIGAGRVDVPKAAETSVIAYNDERVSVMDPVSQEMITTTTGLVSVSFGAVEVSTVVTATKPIRVVNKGDTEVTYDVAYTSSVTMPGVSYAVSAESVTIPADSSAVVSVTMTADAAAMQRTRDETVDDLGAVGLPRHWINEASGYVTMTPPEAEMVGLRVPVHAAPQAVADMRAATETLTFDTEMTGTTTISLTGQPLNTGDNFPIDEVSLATAFELQHTSGITTAEAGRNADIQYVGVASDIRSTATDTVSDTLVYFGISTHDDWTTPSAVLFDIYIDNDQDGTDDLIVHNTNFGNALSTSLNSDEFITATCPVTYTMSTDCTPGLFINGLDAATINTRVFNTNVMMLPIDTASLGLDEEQTSFNYRIVSYSGDLYDTTAGINDSIVVDTTPTLTYNVANPGLDLSNPALTTLFAEAPPAPAYLDLPGTELMIDYDQEAFTAASSEGLLLLHHHNAEGNRAEVLRTPDDAPSGALYFPIIGK